MHDKCGPVKAVAVVKQIRKHVQNMKVDNCASDITYY